MQIHVRNHLLQAARTKASQQYATLRSSHGAVTKPEHGARQWTADDYRNEFMFARVLDVAGSDTHAFATMGDAHLGALQDRFSAQNIPFVRMQDFFGRFSRDAVDTRAIAYDKSPGFRTNRRMTLWLQCALAEYPNLQQWHLDELTESDFGEFAVTGKVTKWESEDQEGESRYQHLLVRLIRDIEKEYPNGEQYISDLTFAQFGEFLLTGNIAAWNAMEN